MYTAHDSSVQLSPSGLDVCVLHTVRWCVDCCLPCLVFTGGVHPENKKRRGILRKDSNLGAAVAVIRHYTEADLEEPVDWSVSYPPSTGS